MQIFNSNTVAQRWANFTQLYNLNKITRFFIKKLDAV
jgi:hypothetical protein